MFAQGHQPECALLDELEGRGLPVTAIGDCVSARSAEQAVLEGLRAAWSL